LVLSTQGRGVFDCNTGEKIARDHDGEYLCNTNRLLAPGFGPLEGKTIRMAGLFGGGLALTTVDGWSFDVDASAWPQHAVFLKEPSSLSQGYFVGDDGACELRAFGFSETGRSFVIAISCDLMIFAR
jgi:hypothetical protein